MNRLLLFLLVLVVFSCKKDQSSSSSNIRSINTHVTAATQGMISAKDDLVYMFKEELPEMDEADLTQLVRLDPEVKGTVSHSNGVVRFDPETLLKPRTSYRVELRVHDLFPNRYQENIWFEVQTFAQSLDVRERGIEIGAQNEISVEYQIKTADYVEPSNLESIVQTDANAFTVRETGTNTYELMLSYQKSMSKKAYLRMNGAKLGADQKFDFKMDDIDASQFAILSSTRLPYQAEIEIRFSQRIKEGQDLTGLIKVNNKDAEYTIKNNIISIYTAGYNKSAKLAVKIAKGILSDTGMALQSEYTLSFDNEVIKPQVKFAKSGHMVPSQGDFIIPISTKALKALRVHVIEIPQKNVHQYLAWESLSNTSSYGMKRYGRVMHNEVMQLTQGIPDDNGWVAYGIDLSKRVERQPGSIYYVSLEIEPAYVDLDCSANLANKDFESRLPKASFFDTQYNRYRDYYHYDWQKREDPCEIAYYYGMEIPARAFQVCHASIVAKQGAGQASISVRDMYSLKALSGAEVKLFDLQGIAIATKNSDNQGVAKFNDLPRPAVVAQVTHNNKISYLPMSSSQSNPLTDFQVSGGQSTSQNGAFVYTERDVWRPGDTIYMDVMLNKKDQVFPAGLPISVKFYNPQNVLMAKKMQAITADTQLYGFKLSTQSQAKTGVYRALIEIGNIRISKNLRIETIKPNQVDIQYDFENEKDGVVLQSSLKGKMNVDYLTGYPVKDAQVKTLVKVVSIRSPFKDYKDYRFDAHNSYTSGYNFDLSNAKTDAEGMLSFESSQDLKSWNSMLRLGIDSEVNLKGGGVNKIGHRVKVSPFESYIGIKRNQGNGWRNNYIFGDQIVLDLVSLDQEGSQSTKSTKVEYTIEKHVSHWWIDKYRLRNDGHFRNNSKWEQQSKNSISVVAENQIKLNSKDYVRGAYRITCTDTESGHQTRAYFSVYDGRSRIPGAKPFIVEFETDKDSYEVGESVQVQLPDIEGAEALISVEQGDKILDQVWYTLKKSDNNISLSSFEEWAPNVFIHVTIIQPYGQENNDLPLRMYGVKPITMSPKGQGLNPKVDMPEVMESLKEYTIEVSEAEGKSMEYTLAVVDEGLLNLTAFKTPDPHRHFNSPQALRVKTWDVYQWLMAYFKGNYAGILSIGGDDAYEADEIIEANRFKSVVTHYGPFKLAAGSKQSHVLKVPQYIGKLRVMLVACNERSFGKLETSALVKNPLMVQSQLPRTLNVRDEFTMPVTVFKDDASIKDVQLSLQTDPAFIAVEKNQQSINMRTDDQSLSGFNLKVRAQVGVTDIALSANAAGHQAEEDTEIAIQYPNAYATDSKQYVIRPGESKIIEVEAQGFINAFESKFQLGGAKVPRLTSFSESLLMYPYGCLEQTTSKAMSQWMLGKIFNLEPASDRKRLENLQAAVLKLRRFQRSDGAFKYWNSGYYHTWGDLHAGLFLTDLVAEGDDYNAKTILDKWTSYTYRIANEWSAQNLSGDYVKNREQFIQAYRLFVLAKANKPAKSAMNRFKKSQTSENPMIYWLLAGAYQHAGYYSEAVKLMEKAESIQKGTKYNHYAASFGNSTRDFALVIEVLAAFDDFQDKKNLYYDRFIKEMDERNYYSTQLMAYSFRAVYFYFGKALDIASKSEFSIIKDGKEAIYEIPSAEPMDYTLAKFDKQSTAISIKNTGDAELYVVQTDRYISDNLRQSPAAKNLSLNVEYRNARTQLTDLSDIKVGDDLEITIKLKNLSALSVENLALNVKMPSGWELKNPRLYESDVTNRNYIHQDFRDDRVYTFFEMKAGESRTYTFKAKAAFKGSFYLPYVSCENMYNDTYYAKSSSSVITIND